MKKKNKTSQIHSSQFYVYSFKASLISLLAVSILNLLTPIRDFNYFRSFYPNVDKVKAEIIETFGLDAIFLICLVGLFVFLIALIILLIYSKLNSRKEKILVFISNILISFLIFPLTAYFYLTIVIFLMAFVFIDIYSLIFIFFMK